MQKRKTQKAFNRRIDVAPEGGVLARLGFYTSPVQKVVRKWQGKVDAETLENYFKRVAMPVVLNNTSLKIEFVRPHHWQLIWELGAAITKVMGDDMNLDKWLLRLPISVARDHEWESWDEIAVKIGGLAKRKEPSLSGTLKTRAKRLKLLTPAELASDYLSVTKTNPKT